MEGLQAMQLWRLAAAMMLLATEGLTTGDICQPASDGSSGKPETLCGSPYCSCNHPYGRVYCSCTSNTLPPVSFLTVKSSGVCRLPSETRDLDIANCVNVTFPENALDSLQNLRTVQISSVKEVVVERHAFHWNRTTTGISILISNTTIANLPSFAFSGFIGKVVFRNVYLGLVKAFAFSSITDTERIQFVGCNFANIEPQSFKKFATEEFQIEQSLFHIIPSRFIHEIHVHKLFRMDSNTVNIVRTLGFQITHPVDTIITRNRVSVLEGEAFSIEVRGSVGIRDNIFETIEPAAFKGIKTDRRTRFPLPPEVNFDNNTLGSFTEASLQFNRPEFSVRFTQMRFDEACTCDRLVELKEMVFPTKKKFPQTPLEAHLPDLWCHEDSKKEVDINFISGEAFYEQNCTPIITGWYFLVIVIVCVVVGLCMLIVVAILLIRRRRQWDAVPTTETEGVTQKPPDPKKGLVLPDGRVYRETEFHVVEEKVEPMEEAVPYIVARDRSKTYIREAPR